MTNKEKWLVIGIEIDDPQREPIIVYEGTYDQCIDYFADFGGMLSEGPYMWQLRIVEGEN